MHEPHLLFVTPERLKKSTWSQLALRCEFVLHIQMHKLSLCRTKFNHTSQIFTEVAQEQQGVGFIFCCGEKRGLNLPHTCCSLTCRRTCFPLFLGWLISSRRCLLSRRRSSLTSLRRSWLQGRESWLQMSPQVSLQFSFLRLWLDANSECAS